MSFENYTVIKLDHGDGLTLRPGGDAASFEFNGEALPYKRYRLFVTGGTEQYYQWKNEPDEPMQYRLLSDALDSAHANKARFCLKLSSKQPENYIRRAYKKVLWPPVLSYLRMRPVPDEWMAGIWVNTRNVQVQPEGYLRIRFDIYKSHEGISRRSVSLPPDEQVILDIPHDTKQWVKLETALHLPVDEMAHVGVWVEGLGYSGQVYVERPYISAGGQNLLPDFDMPVSNKEHFDWTAQNLSRREWPEFEVTLNGRCIFEGEIFERCHVDSEWAIDLPADLVEAKNIVTIRLISDYHDPMPYTLHEVGLIEQAGGAIALIAVSEVAHVDGGAHVLLRTEEDNTSIRFESLDGQLTGQSVYQFEKSGLHGVTLGCSAPGGNARFRFKSGDAVAEGVVSRIVLRKTDGVVTGTGDMIYVAQEEKSAEEYLSWYISNGIGNLLTIRPTYRWSGSRILNVSVWREVVRVLNELGMKYVVMMDGRELPGENSNPDDGIMKGEGYLGRQCHEQDGAQYYWSTRLGSTNLMDEQYNDMIQEIWREDEAHCNPRYKPEGFIYKNDRIYIYRDPETPRDCREAMQTSVAQLQRLRGNVLRHTGPSVMFKYLLAAGYRWVGAETMYGSMEPLMAFLRGACASAGITKMGVHHAVQWSSSPQDAPEHFRRYRLALYVSYMQGATEINTEEGLWHIEEYYSHFHRFSTGCAGHRIQQQDFYRYTTSHTRNGHFLTPMALLHGRYDGWHGFYNRQPWGWVEQNNSAAEDSWDLLKVFYPLSKPGEALYIHGCSTDHAVGYYSGTPLGNIDVIPAESDVSLMERYGALAFMGYHCAEKEDFIRLMDHVCKGGELLLTRAHMNTETDFAAIVRGALVDLEDNPMNFAEGRPIYRTQHVNGRAVEVCINNKIADEVIAYTDEGLPLVCRYRLGQGIVTLINARVYPSDPAVRLLYEQQLTEMMKTQIEKEPIWTETSDDMGSAVYVLDDDSRHVYMTPVDWFRPEARLRTAILRVGHDRYTVELPFGVMTKCVVKDGFAAWPHSENGEVLSVSASGAMVQGIGRVTFTLGHNGQKQDVDIDFGVGGTGKLMF